MKADHFEQQKLLDLAAEDVALSQLAHRGSHLPEVAAVEAAQEAERTFSADVVRAETEVRDLDREQKRLESDVDTVRQREDKDQRQLDSGTVAPNPLSTWAKGPDALPLDGPVRGLTDAVLPDEFPLSMFYEALNRKLSPIVSATAGITG